MYHRQFFADLTNFWNTHFSTCVFKNISLLFKIFQHEHDMIAHFQYKYALIFNTFGADDEKAVYFSCSELVCKDSAAVCFQRGI